jgi:hypothetical protein
MLAGELMRDGSYFAFDCLARNGENMRPWPLRDRLRVLGELSPQMTANGILRPAVGNGGEFLEAILANGGEGIVAKDLDAPYGDMLACKRIAECVCLVTGLVPDVQSVTISDPTTGDPMGRVALRAGKLDKVKIGSLVKVVGMSLTERGLIREPRLCSDTPESWLVKW